MTYARGGQSNEREVTAAGTNLDRLVKDIKDKVKGSEIIISILRFCYKAGRFAVSNSLRWESTKSSGKLIINF